MQMELPVVVEEPKNDQTPEKKCISKKKCHILKRAMLLLALMPTLAAIPYEPLEWSQTLYFLVPVSGLSSYILLINFPIIIKNIHGKPLYFEDLEDDAFIDPLIRKHFQMIFVVMVQITLTMLISGMIYYYYNQFKNTTLSKIELFGIAGGAVSLLMKIENTFGKMILSVLHMCKKRSIEFDKNIRKSRSNSLDYLS